MPVSVKFEDRMPVTNHQERHLAAIILADCSGSMAGKSMEELNRGLQLFGEALAEDSEAQARVDVSVIGFSSDVKTEVGFRPAVEYSAPTLSAGGCTAFNQAINKALDELDIRKAAYKAAEVNYFCPWLFVLSDGLPTDTELETETRQRLQSAIGGRHVVYIPMGIGEADSKLLQSYYPEVYTDREGKTLPKVVLQASSDCFKDAFVWLSNSVASASKAMPGAKSTESAPIPSTITLAL